MYTPPGTPRSRSFTRFTMRVGLLHLGQSVLLDVSITFWRSAVFATFAIMFLRDADMFASPAARLVGARLTLLVSAGWAGQEKAKDERRKNALR